MRHHPCNRQCCLAGPRANDCHDPVCYHPISHSLSLAGGRLASPAHNRPHLIYTAIDLDSAIWPAEFVTLRAAEPPTIVIITSVDGAKIAANRPAQSEPILPAQLAASDPTIASTQLAATVSPTQRGAVPGDQRPAVGKANFWAAANTILSA